MTPEPCQRVGSRQWVAGVGLPPRDRSPWAETLGPASCPRVLSPAPGSRLLPPGPISHLFLSALPPGSTAWGECPHFPFCTLPGSPEVSLGKRWAVLGACGPTWAPAITGLPLLCVNREEASAWPTLWGRASPAPSGGCLPPTAVIPPRRARGLALGWADAWHLKPPGRAVLGSLFPSRLGEGQGFPSPPACRGPAGGGCVVSLGAQLPGAVGRWLPGKVLAGGPGRWWTGDLDGQGLEDRRPGGGDSPSILFIASPVPPPKAGLPEKGFLPFPPQVN